MRVHLLWWPLQNGRSCEKIRQIANVIKPFIAYTPRLSVQVDFFMKSYLNTVQVKRGWTCAALFSELMFFCTSFVVKVDIFWPVPFDCSEEMLHFVLFFKTPPQLPVSSLILHAQLKQQPSNLLKWSESIMHTMEHVKNNSVFDGADDTPRYAITRKKLAHFYFRADKRARGYLKIASLSQYTRVLSISCTNDMYFTLLTLFI